MYLFWQYNVRHTSSRILSLWIWKVSKVIQVSSPHLLWFTFKIFVIFSVYKREQAKAFYDEELASRKEFNNKRKGLFSKEIPTEELSLKNSNRFYHMQLEVSANLTQHSSFPWEIYFDNMHHLEVSTGLWLVNTDHVTWILISYWRKQKWSGESHC